MTYMYMYIVRPICKLDDEDNQSTRNSIILVGEESNPIQLNPQSYQ